MDAEVILKRFNNTTTRQDEASKLKQSYMLDLQQRQEYHGGAVFWSPRKIREAHTREAVQQREDEAVQL
ncbi:hypothetical protein CFE70_010643 [Pyrenophora teres f. teres 0-1]